MPTLTQLQEEEKETLYQTKDGRVFLPAFSFYHNFTTLYQRATGQDLRNYNSSHESLHGDWHDQELAREVQKAAFSTGTRRSNPKFGLGSIQFQEETIQNKDYYKNADSFEDDGKKVYIQRYKNYNNWDYDFADLRIVTER